MWGHKPRTAGGHWKLAFHGQCSPGVQLIATRHFLSPRIPCFTGVLSADAGWLSAGATCPPSPSWSGFSLAGFLLWLSCRAELQALALGLCSLVALNTPGCHLMLAHWVHTHRTPLAQRQQLKTWDRELRSSLKT